MIKKLCMALCAMGSVLLLSGCFSADQAVRAAPDIVNEQVRRTGDEIKGTIAEKLDENQHKVADSQNAMQQNISSLLGVGISKVADKLADIKADVTASITGMANTFNAKIDKIQNDMTVAMTVNNKLTATLEAQMNTNIELRNQIKVSNEMNANLMASLTATMKVNAELEAKVNAMANAVAGFDNKITQTTNDLKQDFKAGHDVIQNQLDNNALKAVQSGNLVAIIIIVSFAFCLIALGVCYMMVRLHSKGRDEAESHSRDMLKMVTKCMPLMNPEASKEILKDLHTKGG